MNKQRVKEQKKKAREKEVKAKLLRRWEAKKAEERKQKDWEAKMEAETNPGGRKRKPYRKGQENQIEIPEEALKQAEVRAKLEHNLQLLRALEAEYQKEQAAKAKLNADLEAQGATDIQSKMDLLAEQTLEVAKAQSDLAADTPEISTEVLLERMHEHAQEVPLTVEPEEIKAKPNKFKGKFQEAAKKVKGRIYPWTPSPSSDGVETQKLLDKVEGALVDAHKDHVASAVCKPKKTKNPE